MSQRILRIGVSVAMLHPGAEHNFVKSKRLLYVEEGLCQWILSHGAVPYLLPSSPSSLISYADLLQPLDGLIMSGGADVCPALYGEEPLRPEWGGDRHRDDHEVSLIRQALAQDLPILGICRGLQILNVTLGGALFQDISTQYETEVVHRNAEVYDRNSHGVALEAGGELRRFYGSGEARINSVHHQAIKRLAGQLQIEARCQEDGLIEAVRLKDAFTYAFATQWHPEWHPRDEGALLSSAPILEDFLAAIRRRLR